MIDGCAGTFDPADWGSIRLVVFDVDGTLYRQRPLRMAMAAELAGHTLRTRSLGDLRTLSVYRRQREAMGDSAPDDFLANLVADVAHRSGRTSQAVDALVAEWIDRRPLRHLLRSRVKGAADLFAGLRRHDIRIGIWSDYPVADKLAALGLAADHLRSACDADIACLKPRPTGLLSIMKEASVGASETLMIGDRADRDGAAAAVAGVRALLRSTRPVPGYRCFADFTDTVFDPVLRA